MRLTRDGMLYLVLTLALTVVALVAGNNLLVLLAAPMWSLWVLQWPLGAWNLMDLDVRRVLPAELYADHDAAGAWLVANRRRWWWSHAIEVLETAAVPGRVDAVGPGDSQRVNGAWRFPRRGLARLGSIELRSRWPFGLVEHRRVVDRPAEVLVYPRPLPGDREARPHQASGAEDVHRKGGAGDFLGLRAFQEGDPPQRISWAASARVGRPMVVERAVEQERAVSIRIDAAAGARWERELRRACGEVQRATRAGEAVGLIVTGTDGSVALALPPSGGLEGRRRALDTLAMLPERA